MIGEMISHYLVLEELSGGSRGMLFKARDTALDRVVAIRLLPADLLEDETAKERFLEETRAVGSLDHPNIAAVHEVAETTDGRLFVVTGWQGGQTLEQRLGSGPLEAGEALGVAADIARGLGAAHARGIVHGGVTPSSIWIGHNGEARLADFRADGVDADTRSDIWGLGTVLYECVSGHRASAGAAQERPKGSLEDPFEGVPGPVTRVIARCLQRDPDDRYSTTAEVLQDLERARQEIAAGAPRSGAGATKRARRLALGAGAALVLFAAAVLALWGAGVIGTAKEPPRVSVAVIPFEGAALPADERWMADAVGDDLIADLSQLKALRVISRNSSSQVKSSDEPREAGRRLTANYLASGALSRSAGGLQVEAWVVRSGDGKEVMRSAYRSVGGSVQVLEDRLRADVLARLGVHPTREEAKRISGMKVISDAAFESLSKGRAFVSGFEPLRAIDYLRRVVELEPEYAEAWAYLAKAYEDAVNLYAVEWPEGRRRSREAAARAVALNPNSSYVHLTVGYLDFMREMRWAEAETNLEASIRENPSSAEAYTAYAWFLYVMGRSEEGEAAAQEAIALDPLWLFARDYYGLFLYFARDYDKSIAVLRAVLALDPNDVMAHYWIAEPYVARGMYREALAEYAAAARVLAGTPFGDAVEVESCRVYALMGQPQRAKSLANAVLSRYPTAERWKLDDAMIYVWIAAGEKDEAFAALDRLYDRGYAGSWLLLLRVVEWLDPLRDDPRYQVLVHKMGLDQKERREAPVAPSPAGEVD